MLAKIIFNSLIMLFIRIFIITVIFFNSVILVAQLSGVYTVGGTSPDYLSLNSAVSDLVTQGISNSVIFNIRDGDYYEQFTLSNINGVSKINNITFQSESGDSSLVTILFASDSITNNFVINLDSASYINFKQITIQSTGSNFGKVIVFRNGSSNNAILNCKLIGLYKKDCLINSGYADVDSANIIKYNLFINGINGIAFNGPNGPNFETQTIIENNIFINQLGAILLINQKSCKVNNNKIYSFLSDSIPNSGSRSAIYAGNVDDNVEINNNEINIKSDITNVDFYGIFLLQSNGSVNSTNSVINNEINIVSAQNLNEIINLCGINLQEVSYTNILYNSIKIEGTNRLNSAISVWLNVNSKIKNNIFVNTTGVDSSTAMTVRGSPTLYPNEITNNCLYSASTNLVYASWPAYIYVNTLSDWQQLTGYDLNSINVDPLFTDSLLHISAESSLCGKGVSVAEVIYDIEGNLRNNPPTIGAHELNPCVTGVGEEVDSLLSFEFTLFPNPANDILNIKANKEGFSLEILDINGKVIKSVKVIDANQSYMLDFSNFSGGIYYCKVSDRNKFSMKRFIIVR